MLNKNTVILARFGDLFDVFTVADAITALICSTTIVCFHHINTFEDLSFIILLCLWFGFLLQTKVLGWETALEDGIIPSS